jgi:hypothetical protein
MTAGSRPLRSLEAAGSNRQLASLLLRLGTDTQAQAKLDAAFRRPVSLVAGLDVALDSCSKRASRPHSTVTSDSAARRAGSKAMGLELLARRRPRRRRDGGALPTGSTPPMW